MARQKENNIRDEMIANLLEDLAAEIGQKEPQGEQTREEKDDKTNPIENMLYPEDLHRSDPHAAHSVALDENNLSDKPSQFSTEVATEILPAPEAIDQVLPDDPQKTEIATRIEELTQSVTRINQKNPEQPKGPENKTQAFHYLKLAQDKIADLEKEIDRLREENELLTIAAQTAKKQAEEFSERLTQYERERIEVLERAQLEMNIYRENLATKEKERKTLEERVRQLEGSVAKEIKKIRNRERELENRLELSKQEKITLLRAKDEIILDLRRRIDDLNMEIESHRAQYAELKSKADFQHGQLSRTVKALRLALAHLESEGENQTVPFKKAE